MENVSIHNNKQKTYGKDAAEKARIGFFVDALKGLGAKKKSLSSKYLYDEKGSELFKQITELDEYYLTKAEKNVFETRSADIVGYISSSEVDLVELGVGDGRKTKILLNELSKRNIRTKFYAIDISGEALSQFERNIEELQGLEICAVEGEYLEGLEFARSKSDRQMVVLFLGSNIGNFFPKERIEFLKSLRKNMNPGDLMLTGFDLKKDISLIQAAYDDSQGVTAKFNLNLLERMNRELGANFDTSKFTHHALYNPVLGAMESHIVSKVEQEVYVKEFDKVFSFDAYEPIHLEYSFKFSQKEVEGLAKESGFICLEHFFDEKKLYMDSLWEAGSAKIKIH